jgi:hypothetical protein
MTSSLLAFLLVVFCGHIDVPIGLGGVFLRVPEAAASS